MEPGAHPIECLELDVVAARHAALMRLRTKRVRAAEAIAELVDEAEACKAIGLSEAAQFALDRVRAVA